MDIVVHGTKGGRQIFTPKKIGGLLDVNADTSKAAAIGQEVFAIRFVENSTIFSKYKIIRDVRGDKRTGFLAFSLFISNNQYLQGKEIVSVLNKVSEEYYKRYIPDNDNNLKDVREEWGFLDDILNDYRSKVKNRSIDDIDSLLSGTRDDAFAFYEDEESLEKYIDQPYQEEYRQYRQILLIRSELKDKPECPLNALRHSDNPNDNLTGRVDLDKRIYVLRDFDGNAKNGVSIDISVRGKRLRKNDRISSKDIISIRYFKKHSRDLVVKEGRMSDDWIKKYLVYADDTSKRIDVERNIDLDTVVKTITFNIRDWQKKEVKGAEIICKCRDCVKKTENNNQITFSGDDFEKRWWVSAKNDWLYSDDRQINFESDCPMDNGSIDIILNKHKLNITALDSLNGDILDNLKYSKQEFTGSEINDPHKITISRQGYESLSFNYFPAEDYKASIHKHLSKKLMQDNASFSNHKYFTARVGNHGTWTDGSSVEKLSISSNGFDLERTIKPHKGWKFVKFEKNGEMLIAKYEQKVRKYESPKSLAIALFIFIVCVICAVYFLVWNKNSVKFEKPDLENIKAYIEGDTLFLERLTNYRKTLDREQKELSDKLDSAIQIRMFINRKNFDTLKKMHFYPLQKEFAEAVEKIQSDHYKEFQNKFGDISSWDLNKIRDTINKYLETSKTKTDSKPEEDTKEVESNNSQSKKEIKEGINETHLNTTNRSNIITPGKNDSEQATAPPNKTNSVNLNTELKKGTVTKVDLQEWRITANKSLIESIDLYLHFWDIVKASQKMDDFRHLLDKVKGDKNLKNSELRTFLSSICANSDAFQKFNSILGKGKYTTINTLKSKFVQ